MNFIEVTNPYARQLEAWKQGHGFSDRKALQELSDIWYEFANIPERKKVIYGSDKAQFPKTDLGCGPCVTDMLQFVTNWRRILENEVPMMEFKGIPQAKIEVSGEFKRGEVAELNIETKFGTLEIDLDPKEEEDIDNPKTRLWRIRQIAKRIHIKFTPKLTKDEIIALIKEKIKELKNRNNG